MRSDQFMIPSIRSAVAVSTVRRMIARYDSRMDTVGQRVRFAREAAGMNGKQLADAIGMSPSALSDLETGRSKKTSLIPEIARQTGFSSYWLQTGRGHQKERAEPIAMFPSQVQDDRLWVIPRLDVWLEMGSGEGPQWEGESPPELQGNAFREDFCRAQGWHPSTHVTVRVDGLSMIEAGLRPGWSVVVDTRREACEIEDGEVYAIQEGDNATQCKYLEKTADGGLRIISANSSHPVYRKLSPEEAEHVRIYGRVVHAQGLIGAKY